MNTNKQPRYMESRITLTDWRNIFRLDPALLLLVGGLVFFGLTTLHSAGRSMDVSTPYYLKQMAFFAIGVGVMLAVVCIDHRALLSLAPLFYIGTILLLVAVLLWGPVVKGAQRWLVVGPFRLQPSEFSKLSLIFMLAWYFSLVKERIKKLPYFLLTFVIAAVPAILILKQPNLGTTMVLGPIVLVMLFVAGCNRWHLAVLVLIGLIGVPTVYSQLNEYQRLRIVGFLMSDEPAEDSKWGVLHEKLVKGVTEHGAPKRRIVDLTWQTDQTKIAVGSGGLTGKGHGKSTQTYLSYLPEYHTDFVFALLAEEQGFLGAACVIVLYAFLFLRGLWLAGVAPDQSGCLLATGVVTMLATHVFINIAITLGMMPVTGIPLPFLSYGGTFALTTMLCIGIILCVPMRRGLLATAQ